MAMTFDLWGVAYRIAPPMGVVESCFVAKNRTGNVVALVRSSALILFVMDSQLDVSLLVKRFSTLSVDDVGLLIKGGSSSGRGQCDIALS